MIVVNQADIEAGYSLYKGISKSNELGIPPEVLTFFEKIVEPELEMPRIEEISTREGSEEIDKSGMASMKDFSRKYYQVFHKTIGKKRLKKTVEMLLETGLLIEDKDPWDRRVTVYSHPVGYISNQQKEGQNQPNLHDKIYTLRGVGTDFYKLKNDGE
jgi:hypothetical protein